VAAGTCINQDCTVATTGKCLLSHPDPAQCPQFRGEVASGLAAAGVVPEDDPERQGTEKSGGRKFHLGNELGAEDAAEIMRARYSHVIGVLGSSDAGKTCFLSSLYLMASGGTLPAPFEFAGSFTLQAFEDRARGLREWHDGQLPLQLADRTLLSDPRQPSLLHLAIRESGELRRRFDLLLTDLPGEWTDKLVLHASNAQAFRFLQRADGIILVVDGTVLKSNQRHVEVQRMRNFTERLANDVNVSRDTPIVILVSKSDEIDMQMPAAANELMLHVRGLGYQVTAISAASFSRNPGEVKSGTGVLEAVRTILAYPDAAPYAAARIDESLLGTRSFQDFRG
jgi:hypothetical protein